MDFLFFTIFKVLKKESQPSFAIRSSAPLATSGFRSNTPQFLNVKWFSFINVDFVFTGNAFGRKSLKVLR